MYVDSLAKAMSESIYENEITCGMHCVVYGETCFLMFGIFVCVKQNSSSFSLCPAVCARAVWLSVGSHNSESKALCPRLPRPVSVWLGHLLATAVSSWVVAGWHVWRAHTPPGNALCQVFILLQQLWCLHPSLLPP